MVYSHQPHARKAPLGQICDEILNPAIPMALRLSGILMHDVSVTLGPRGMDKLIHDDKGSVTVSNDGATIMKLLDIVHPAAKILVDIAKSQDSEVGDGTTTVVLLAAEFLREAKSFIEDGVHYQNLIRSYRTACSLAIEKVKELAVSIEGKSLEEKKSLLGKCAATTLSSKLIGGEKEFFASMVVDAVITIGTDDRLNMIGIKEVIPRQLCANAGFDATDVLNKLRQKHALPSGEGAPFGVDIATGGIADSFANFVWEPAVVKINAINAATEAACLVLSVDETVKNPKVELCRPDAELRLLEVFYHKIYKVFPPNEKIENINDQYWTLRAEEVLPVDKELPENVPVHEDTPHVLSEKSDSKSILSRRMRIRKQMLMVIVFMMMVLGNVDSFSFTDVPAGSKELGLRGDATLAGNVVNLLKTKTPSWGAVMHDVPISLVENIEEKKCYSFSTHFSFSITIPPDRLSYTEGFAFFISPYNLSTSLTGLFGLPRSDFVAVLFDSRTDPKSTSDAGKSKISFIANSIVPIEQIDPEFETIDILTGNIVNCWIEYVNGQGSMAVNSLHVFLSYSNQKPKKSILTTTIDLCQFFMDYDTLYTGISASDSGQGNSESDGLSAELPRIYDWEFETLQNEKSPENVSFLVFYILVLVVVVLLIIVVALCYKLYTLKTKQSNVVREYELTPLPTYRRISSSHRTSDLFGSQRSERFFLGDRRRDVSGSFGIPIASQEIEEVEDVSEYDKEVENPKQGEPQGGEGSTERNKSPNVCGQENIEGGELNLGKRKSKRKAKKPRWLEGFDCSTKVKFKVKSMKKNKK